MFLIQKYRGVHMSIQFEVQKTFHVPKENAYNSLLDLDAAEQWIQGVVKIERLAEGPRKVASQWLETRKMNGKESTEQFEMVELHEPNKIVFRCEGTKGTTGKG